MFLKCIEDVSEPGPQCKIFEKIVLLMSEYLHILWCVILSCFSKNEKIPIWGRRSSVGGGLDEFALHDIPSMRFASRFACFGRFVFVIDGIGILFCSGRLCERRSSPQNFKNTKLTYSNLVNTSRHELVFFHFDRPRTRGNGSVFHFKSEGKKRFSRVHVDDLVCFFFLLFAVKTRILESSRTLKKHDKALNLTSSDNFREQGTQ